MPSNQVQGLIVAYARKYGIDPDVALRVAMSEGGVRYGAVGDQGSSYGPYQLHRGGALPRGRNAAWANSPAGIEYAIRSASQYARGKHGQAGVDAFVRGFERPANPAAEVARAMGFNLGNYASGGAPSAPPMVGGSSGGMKLDLVKYLAASNASIANHTATPFIKDFIGQQEAPQMATGSPLTGSIGISGPRTFGKISFMKGADRAGVHTQPGVIQFARQVAGIAGQPLSIGTGTNHSEYTVDGNVSDHWRGNAVDIPATGPKLIRIGQAALIAAGMPPAQARKQHGGLYNVGGHQIIFNTHQGGDHTNHLHISARGK